MSINGDPTERVLLFSTSIMYSYQRSTASPSDIVCTKVKEVHLRTPYGWGFVSNRELDINSGDNEETAELRSKERTKRVERRRTERCRKYKEEHQEEEERW